MTSTAPSPVARLQATLSARFRPATADSIGPADHPNGRHAGEVPR